MLTLNAKLALSATAAKAYKNILGENTSTLSATAVRSTLDLWVGSGNTAPTVNDVALESRITTLQKASSSSALAANYGDNFTITASTTYINNTGSDITVSELGVVANSASDALTILLAREVIDPVVIPANGGQKTFTVTIG